VRPLASATPAPTLAGDAATAILAVTRRTLLLIRERAEPSRSAGKLLGVVLGVFDPEVPDLVAVRFGDHDGVFGQHAFDPETDVVERIHTFVDRITDGAQQQDARPGCTGQRQDGAEDPDRVVSCPAVTGRSDGNGRPRANPGTGSHGRRHLGPMRPRRDAPGTL
jgi:hypothetical protein